MLRDGQYASCCWELICARWTHVCSLDTNAIYIGVVMVGDFSNVGLYCDAGTHHRNLGFSLRSAGRSLEAAETWREALSQELVGDPELETS